MALIICIPKFNTLKPSPLDHQIYDLCEDVISHDGKVLFIPRPGMVMALLRILNEDGVEYHFHDVTSDKQMMMLSHHKISARAKLKTQGDPYKK